MPPRDASGIATKRDRSSFERCVRLSDLLRARSRPRPSRPIAGRPFAHSSGITIAHQSRPRAYRVARRSKTKQVRLQLGATGGPFSVASNIIKNEGFGTLYTGISAGLLRQATYTTARLGIHAKIVDFLKEQNKGAPLPLVQKAGAGLAAGGLGAIFGSPADLSLIRMQADGTLPAAERRNYTGVAHALTDIVKKDGVGGLFVGASTTAVRAMALNMGMLASNDQAKEMMKENGITGFPATLGASSIAGFFASFFSLPFDYVKTQLQKQKPLPDGTMPFKGFGDCVAKTMAEGGPLKFYTGFPTYYVRIAPHAMFTLIILDQINAAQKSMGA